MTAPGGRTVAWLLVRGLSVVYLMAFASAWVQVEGLYGADGLLPVGETLAGDGFVPTVLWLDPTGRGLHLVAAGGVLAGLLCLVGLAPRATLALQWVLYLSIVSIDRHVFFAFQWDFLLLEAGFLGVWVAPWGLRPGRASLEPPRIPIWLLRFLLFRLVFMSGLVKFAGWFGVASGDPTWYDLSALDYHFETQPLPTPLAWTVHHLPAWTRRVGVVLVFLLEVPLPVLVFGGRRARLAAAIGIGSLQLLILATGNFGFFPWLCLVLCLTLLDDGWLPERGRLERAERPPALEMAYLPLALLVALLLVAGDRPVIARWTAPLGLVNDYGVFGQMTTERHEVVLEGTADGHTWQAYTFRHKPPDDDGRPGFLIGHMPRLDWRLWFVPLTDEPWLGRLLDRLLEASRPVLDLLADDPFDGRRPVAVRAVLTRYRFGQDAWWEAATGRVVAVREME